MKKLICLLTVVSVLFTCGITSFADGTTVLTLEVPEPKTTYTLQIPENQSIKYKEYENSIGTVKVTESKDFADNEYVSVKLGYSGEFTSQTTETKLPVSVQFDAIPRTSGYHTLADIGVHAKNTILFKNNGEGGVNETGTIVMTETQEELSLDHLLIFVNEQTWEGYPLDPGTYTMSITFTSQVVTQ